MAADPLLPELVEKILTRLPVKSIVRCESVSREWSALIQSPFFIAAHLSHSSSHNAALLIEYAHAYNFDKGIRFLGAQENLDVSNIMRNSSSPSFPKIVGSCNGLICLDISRWRDGLNLVLWNPATRKFRHLPQPRNEDFEGKQSYVDALAFGFQEKAKDYKIVRIMSYGNIKHGFPDKRAEIFSRNKGSWSWMNMEELGILSSVVIYGEQGTMVGGSLYWIAIGTRELSGQKFLVSLDMESEKLKKTILLPISGSVTFSMKVIAYGGGSVGLVVCKNASAELWIITENNISGDGCEMVKVSTVYFLRQTWIPKGFWKGKVVVQREDTTLRRELISYDPNSSDIVERISVRRAYYNSYEVHNFMESLISVERGNN